MSNDIKVGDICTLNNRNRSGKGVVYSVESIKESPHYRPGLLTLRPVFAPFLDISGYPRIFDANPGDCRRLTYRDLCDTATRLDEFVYKHVDKE